MEQVMLSIMNVSKEYILGQFGGATLRDELQRWSAKRRGKEDPNKIFGEKDYTRGDKFLALDNISFEVNKGERVGIIGHNGAGKSTLLKLISRVTAPTNGTIGLNGRVASMLEVGTGFHGELTGRENIYMNGAILGMSKKEIDSKIEDIIEFSEVRQFIDTPVKRYSSGMYVKLAFSVAAHLDSEIMIMDEVLAVGDMAFQKKCLDKMKRISQSNLRTILYVSHNMSTIRQLCERVVVLDHGKIVFDGSVDEGIDVYMGTKANDYPNYYNLSETTRPYKQHGQFIRVLSFEYIGVTQAIFDSNTPVRFAINFECKKSYKDLGIYFVLKSKEDPIGLAQNIKEMGECFSGCVYRFIYEFNANNIADGEYSFYLDIFEYDGNGKHFSLDHPDQLIKLKLYSTNSKGLDWNSHYYGHILLDDIHLIEKELCSAQCEQR